MRTALTVNSVRVRLRWEENDALPGSVHLWWASAKGTALKEDSVSDGIQDVVKDD